ncbi:MAG: alpha/beta hydrolase [Pseudomonadota bacterium]
MGDFTTSDGIRLVYDDAVIGAPAGGPVILCLAGLTRSALDFEYLLPHLHGARVIRLDYRGRGRSGWAPPETYSIPVETRDVIELLDHLGLNKVAVIGTSRGGIIAMTLAATAKDRLAGVCLNDIGPELDPAGIDKIRGYVGVAPAYATLAEAAEGWGKGMEALGFEGVPAARWAEEVGHHFRETPDGLSLAYDPGLAQIFRVATAAPAPDLWPLFDAMAGLPLALIRGAVSDILSEETAAEMGKRRPDMVFRDVPGRGHIPFLDETEALTAIAEWRALL